MRYGTSKQIKELESKAETLRRGMLVLVAIILLLVIGVAWFDVSYKDCLSTSNRTITRLYSDLMEFNCWYEYCSRGLCMTLKTNCKNIEKKCLDEPYLSQWHLTCEWVNDTCTCEVD